ncbi:hypothetical protein AMATHDRAFT_10032 [Amanita thiersii Skay4041]|uniref:CCHC-type domain-containing protein n=1 Tax=Amanita thiersii Skay4041 TaxID=703135 RepID=A0A2A9NBL2_9AGAR|nr:hypothetical protein AMATHDRAFT_10032 [Amanita thiersii Skay4041]
MPSLDPTFSVNYAGLSPPAVMGYGRKEALGNVEEKGQNNGSAQIALLAKAGKGKSSAKDAQKEAKKKKKCHYCRKKGHYKDECQIMKADLAAKDQKPAATSDKKEADLTAKVLTVRNAG